jgi:type IV secretory pathway component VirB8
MENEILQKFEEQDKKLGDIYRSIEKMRKYFLWTLIVTIAMIVLPLIALVLIMPWFIRIITSAYTI